MSLYYPTSYTYILYLQQKAYRQRTEIRTSVTRRIDYFFVFDPFQQWKLLPNNIKIDRVVPEYYIGPQKIAKDF